MRVIVQPFSIVIAPNGTTATSAASTIVASTAGSRRCVLLVLAILSFVARLLRVRIFASFDLAAGVFVASRRSALCDQLRKLEVFLRSRFWLAAVELDELMRNQCSRARLHLVARASFSQNSAGCAS